MLVRFRWRIVRHRERDGEGSENMGREKQKDSKRERGTDTESNLSLGTRCLIAFHTTHDPVPPWAEQ